MLHVRFTCSVKARRGLSHRTPQVRSVDLQFATLLSIHSLLRVWQFFFVVLARLPAQTSRTLETLDVFVVDSKTHSQKCVRQMPQSTTTELGSVRVPSLMAQSTPRTGGTASRVASVSEPP